MAAEGVPHLLAGESIHCLGSVVTYPADLPSNFCDRYFHQLDDTLSLGINNLILSCGNFNVRISDLELETVA